MVYASVVVSPTFCFLFFLNASTFCSFMSFLYTKPSSFMFFLFELYQFLFFSHRRILVLCSEIFVL